MTTPESVIASEVRIRERLGRRVRLVALSGFPDDDVDGVFDHHVAKPVDPGFLRSLLG